MIKTKCGNFFYDIELEQLSEYGVVLPKEENDGDYIKKYTPPGNSGGKKKTDPNGKRCGIHPPEDMQDVIMKTVAEVNAIISHVNIAPPPSPHIKKKHN